MRGTGRESSEDFSDPFSYYRQPVTLNTTLQRMREAVLADIERRRRRREDLVKSSQGASKDALS